MAACHESRRLAEESSADLINAWAENGSEWSLGKSGRGGTTTALERLLMQQFQRFPRAGNCQIEIAKLVF